MTGSLFKCPDCEDRGWTVGHERECYEGDGCVCSGVQVQCSCQQDEPLADDGVAF